MQADHLEDHQRRSERPQLQPQNQQKIQISAITKEDGYSSVPAQRDAERVQESICGVMLKLFPLGSSFESVHLQSSDL